MNEDRLSLKLKHWKREEDSLLGCAMYQLHPISRDNINERPTNVFDMYAQPVVLDIDALILYIDRHSYLDFMPLQGALGARDPAKKSLSDGTLTRMWVLVHASHDPGISSHRS